MANRHKCGRAGAKGSALLIALIFLVLFASMAVAIAASADINLTISRNRIEARQAAALAETGLLLLKRNLGGLTVPSTSVAEDLHEAVASHLVTAWDASSMLNAGDIWADADAVHFPTITLTRDDGQVGNLDLAFSADGGAPTTPTITVESTGRFGKAVRTVRYRMTTENGYSLGPYGIASRSRISMTGNARIQGANNNAEGSILSATYSQTNAIFLNGNIGISGDVAVCNPSGKIKKVGSVNIGGSETLGAPDSIWPEVDPSVFMPYVQDTFSGSTTDRTLINVRIPANTNPTFNGNTTILGVLYIEAPNKVTFGGDTTITGTIVGEKPQVQSLTANQIKFTGNVTTAGVESLPDESCYNGLRSLTGSFLLADGYSVAFTGNFGTINGCMVGSNFEFTGNAIGTVRGGVINLDDSDFSLTVNACLTIDKNTPYNRPAGLKVPYFLVCVSGSYEE